MGDELSVRGPVVSAIYATDTDSKPTYLNIGKDFPDENRFVVVVFGDDRANFRSPPQDAYSGKEVALTEEVTEFDGVAQIIANHPNDIAVC